MPYPEQHFRWSWLLASPPAALWSLVSNTDRFNRDCGYPPITEVPRTPSNGAPANARRLRTSVAGVVIEYDEFAFEWVAPRRFGVERVYHRGPLARVVVDCELQPEGTGTRLTYDMRVTAAGLLGRLAAPLTIGRQAGATMARVFRDYDRLAQRGLKYSTLARQPKLAVGGADRLTHLAGALVTKHGQPEPLVERLRDFLRSADDLSASRMRAYALADEWRIGRRETLHLFLHATRAGLLDFSWQTICPHCRGGNAGVNSLDQVGADAHCDSCNVDFSANFDQSIELTFTPNGAIRSVSRPAYCVGGPQVTPHIVAQQSVSAGSERAIRIEAAPGRYRVRTPSSPVQVAFRVARDAPPTARLSLGETTDEFSLAPGGELVVRNSGAEARLAVVEHLAWTDQATTASEVTSLQVFRDLFSREVLRPGERISVGSITLVFTDLKDSTRMYQEVGDAPAFGRVLTHFEILKSAVATEGGAIVKTMGDAIMAVFPRPIAAVRAVLEAKAWLAAPDRFAASAGLRVPAESLVPLALKAGVHTGSCLAINQNDRLDYFGTVVNVAARLCGQCTGSDIVLSTAICADPEVRAFLDSPSGPPQRMDRVQLKGLGETPIEICRLSDV